MTKITETPIGKAYTIISSDGGTQATFIPQAGGIGSSIIMPGAKGPRELLHQHPFFWNPDENQLRGGWPFCFPICGRLERYGKEGAYFFQDQVYSLSIHGFAWQQPWQVADNDTAHIKLVLEDSEQTRNIYPCQFRIELDYKVEKSALICKQTYLNRGDKPMPFYAGFHPYFATPAFKHGKEEVILDYHPVKCLAYNERLTDLVGEQALFSVPTSITADINERLTKLGADKDLKLRFPDGDVIQMTVTGIKDPDLFPYVQLYSPLEQPFICIEPWMAHPNAMNTVSGVCWLNSGESMEGLMELRLK